MEKLRFQINSLFLMRLFYELRSQVINAAIKAFLGNGIDLKKKKAGLF